MTNPAGSPFDDRPTEQFTPVPDPVPTPVRHRRRRRRASTFARLELLFELAVLALSAYVLYRLYTSPRTSVWIDAAITVAVVGLWVPTASCGRDLRRRTRDQHDDGDECR